MWGNLFIRRDHRRKGGREFSVVTEDKKEHSANRNETSNEKGFEKEENANGRKGSSISEGSPFLDTERYLKETIRLASDMGKMRER